ncbi:MAG TPA: hypothetical protein PLC24_09405 [Myxococcota bacterium]|nr:hypothetical protein [Myxococcota bacterium]
MRCHRVSQFSRYSALFPSASFCMVLTAMSLISGVARATDATEPLLDSLVEANFKDDYGAAGAALRQLVEFQRAAGIEPSGKLAVVQVNETLAFADKMDARISRYIEDGFPVLAAMELAKFRDVLLFEPAGAARARDAAAKVQEAGRTLCGELRATAAGAARAVILAEAVCAAFGDGRPAVGQGGGQAAGLGPGQGLSPVAAPVGIINVDSRVKGFLQSVPIDKSLNAAAAARGLLSNGAEGVLSCVIDGTSVVSKSSLPGTLAFEYGVQVPYSEMQEYCEWKEDASTKIVEQDGRKKKVTETTRTCIKKQRPVDLVRVDKHVRQVSGTNWKRSAVWQIRASFDDGSGCSGQKSFDGQRVDNDFVHDKSDPAIGLKPDPLEFPGEDAVAADLAAQVATWLVGVYGDCQKARLCGPAGSGRFGGDGVAGENTGTAGAATGAEPPSLDSVLRCAGIPGGDRGQVDAAIVAKFGVTLNELLAFCGLSP